jgi:hypothetical protein
MFGSVFILADQSLEGVHHTACDSRSLASLLLIRDMISRQLKSPRAFAPPLTPSNALTPGMFSSFRIPSFKMERRKSALVEKRASTLEKQFTQRNLLPDKPAVSQITRQSSDGGEVESNSFYVKRHSPVGQSLFFENKTGSSILISEILDANIKTLIPGTDGQGDYVMSNEAVACTLALVSECRDANVVINELLQAEGNDLHLRSALDYGFPGEKVDFWTLQARARARAEICIGYRAFGDKAPTINPKEKSAKVVLHPKAMVICISEDNGSESNNAMEDGNVPESEEEDEIVEPATLTSFTETKEEEEAGSGKAAAPSLATTKEQARKARDVVYTRALVVLALLAFFVFSPQVTLLVFILCLSVVFVWMKEERAAAPKSSVSRPPINRRRRLSSKTVAPPAHKTSDLSRMTLGETKG